MTRTGLSPRLGQHLPEPFVEVHPDDALRFGLSDGSFARVTTDYGQCTLKVVVSERQQRGMLFAPIHWSEANATAARVGSLVAPFTDPWSGQPENKATPASIAPYEYVFSGFALSRKPLALPEHAWWARVAVTGGHGYLLADNADLKGWQRWLRAGAGEDFAEYFDFGGGVYRGASFADGRIESCLFIGPAHDAGDWNVVKDLFAAGPLTDTQRRMLLSGRAGDGVAPTGAIVCACFGVGRTTISRRDRSRRAYASRDRQKAQGRHQLRLMRARDEAVDCGGGRRGRRAAEAGGGELSSQTLIPRSAHSARLEG